MKIDDIRVSRAANDSGAAEVTLSDEDGAEIRIYVPIGANVGEDRASILDEARSLLVAATDAIGAPTALPDGLTPANGNDEVPIETLEAADGGRPLESLEEDDDNAYQEPDEALPDEREEQALAAGLTRGRFGDPA
ncbi:hypothetical protein GTW25_09030 [Aliihoeflea aestuarii]|uniref:hypothetical protein n=1 Tax=Aliihoeflea aestuarii TaxID=453840 RepID=UPI00209319E2|nr:hypothetical protein [Aliihoeflea aestuarii]MCO6391169.1 hypothetical protein [Aliihoeflea aestuarii]